VEDTKVLEAPSVLKPLQPAFIDTYKEQIMQKATDKRKQEETDRLTAMLSGQTKGGLVVRKKQKTESASAELHFGEASGNGGASASVAQDGLYVANGRSAMDETATEEEQESALNWAPPANQTGYAFGGRCLVSPLLSHTPSTFQRWYNAAECQIWILKKCSTNRVSMRLHGLTEVRVRSCVAFCERVNGATIGDDQGDG